MHCVGGVLLSMCVCDVWLSLQFCTCLVLFFVLEGFFFFFW